MCCVMKKFCMLYDTGCVCQTQCEVLEPNTPRCCPCASVSLLPLSCSALP
jgi:hypothetical protein